MKWTAIVPLKSTDDRKTRLAGHLTRSARAALTTGLLFRLERALERTAAVGRIILLSNDPPPGWRHAVRRDRGRGLNREVTALRAGLAGAPVLVISPDLPLVGSEDIRALLAAAVARGAAVATDRHRRGTNAVALMPGRPFIFRFGRDSLAHHRRQEAVAIARRGLMIDVDYPRDVERWCGSIKL